MREDPYIEWLRESLNQPDKSRKDLAAALGLDVSAISKILANKRKLTSAEMAIAAGYLGTPQPNSDLRLTTAVVAPLPVAGKVAAGVFREVDDQDQSEIKWISLPPDEQFPNARRMAFDVEGDSMNRLEPRPVLNGDRAICVSFEDIADQVKVRDGMIVVVERTRDGGHTREWSLKQVQYFADRIEFCPRSSNKKYKPIVVPHDHAPNDGVTVEIIALLRNVISQYTF